MSANPKWQRWLFATLAGMLRAAGETANVPTHIEVLDVLSTEVKTAEDKAECTLHGYSVAPSAGGEFRVTVSVTIIVATMVERDGYAYDHFDRVGAFVAALAGCFTVRKYENAYRHGVDDPPEAVGVMDLVTGEREAVLVTDLRPTDTDQVYNSTIEADFVGTFDGV